MASKKKSKKKTKTVVKELVSVIQPLPGTSTAFDTNQTTTDNSVPEIDYKNQYVITVDRNDTLPSISALKKKDILGVVIEAGYLYSSNHTEVQNFQNPKLDTFMSEIVKHAYPFGFYFNARATSEAEIRKEIYQLSFVVRKYPPQLGVWLKLDLTSSKTKNGKLLNYYYEKLSELGLVGQLGLYVTKSQLATITWEDFQDDWWLWIISKYKKQDKLSTKVNPSLFDIEEK